MADEGKTSCTQPILVTSNQPSVELTVNGKSLGKKEVVDGLTSWNVPFANGINTIVASTSNATDNESIEFILHPTTFTENGSEVKTLNLLLGTNRYFKDPETNVIWMPDQPYRKGSYGHIGGNPFQLKNSQRTPFGTDKAIALTDNDPVYQTQQVGIEAYRFDVPVGKYEITLHFAELEGGTTTELVYNLGSKNNEKAETVSERVFDLYINGNLLLKNFNIAEQFGLTKAVSIKTPVTVKDETGITIRFHAIRNKTILNAIQLKSTF
jgi:beta-galactosidase